MSITFLAPHASLPALDGASARSWGICQAVSSFRQGSSVNYFSKHRFLNISSGSEIQIRTLDFSRSKIRSALQALLFRRHYLEVKHTPRAWINAVLRELEKSPSDLLYIHFLWASPAFIKVAGSMGSQLVIDTHNFDPEWWDNMASTSRWPWEKSLALISRDSVLKTLEKLPINTTLLHVSDTDSVRYQKLRPDLKHLVLPNGCTMRPRKCIPDYTSPIKNLYFLGALNLQMTRDAVHHFKDHFWTSLAPFCRFHLIGSGNHSAWSDMCRELGWHLHPNLSEDELSSLLSSMHYLVLPFNYGAGSKLKFIDACARGIPVISTQPGVCGFVNLPPSVRISENPKDWKQWITDIIPPDEESASSLNFARQYSWDYLVEEIWPQIIQSPAIS